MKVIKKLNWWKKFWGTRFFITEVEEGLKEDEIIVRGHKVYIKKGILKKEGNDE